MSGQKMLVIGVSAALGLLVGIGASHALAPPAPLPAHVPSIGTAPMVPHDDYPEESCANCHGPQVSAEMGVTLTPHPERRMCRQCHLPTKDVTLFVENDWSK